MLNKYRLLKQRFEQILAPVYYPLLAKVTPYRALFILISLLALGAAAAHGLDYLPWLALAVMLTVFFDAVFLSLKIGRMAFSVKSLISGVFIGSLLSPSLPVWALALATATAMGLKHCLRPSGRHIFNPAMSGIVAATLATQVPIAWWVPARLDAWWILLAFLVLIVFISVQSVPLGFISVYALLTILIFKIPLALALADPTMLYFAFFMATEPRTSPNTQFGKFIFGAAIGAAAVTASRLPLSLAFPAALFLGNLVRTPINRLVVKGG